MKGFLTTAVIAMVSAVSLSAKRQDITEIHGTVVESGSGEALGWATVALMNADGSLAAGTSCDEQGRFTLTVSPGTYSLGVSFIGFKERREEMTVKGQRMELGKIALEAEDTQLTGAVVTSREKLIEMKMDRLVMNLGQSAFAQGSDAMELIRKAPGITVDKDGNIKLNGKDVSVWIDGRPSYLDGKALEALLRGTSGESIDKFEIMAHPSAKYDAAGQGGIINIKTKKNMLAGLNGSLGANGGGMYFSEFEKFLAQGSGWANLSYRTAKSNTFLNLSGGYTQTGMDMNLINEIDCEGGYVYRQDSDSRLQMRFGNYDVKFGNDWFID